MYSLGFARRLASRVGSLSSLSNDQIREGIRSIEHRIQYGEKENQWLPELVLLAATCTQRVLGVALRPVQMYGALMLSRSCIAEMQTGEGKTFTAIGAVAAFALRRRGCHVLTANEYLAVRDSDSLRPVYAMMGLSTGCVIGSMNDDERRQAYACDIVYSTVAEVGFDYLRDRVRIGPVEVDMDFARALRDFGCVHREFFAAVVDEADSVMIDDASTPLILGAESDDKEGFTALHQCASKIASKLIQDLDFELDVAAKKVWLFESARTRLLLHARSVFAIRNTNEQILEAIEKSLEALYCFHRNIDYLVQDGEVVLVSQSTGRKMVGRKWQAGLHQAIEAKEGIEVSATTQTIARVTVQRFLGQYQRLSGMTGTALQSKREFRRFYKLKVLTIPPNQPCRRKRLPTQVYLTNTEKLLAVVEEAISLRDADRAVLIGTVSVSVSEGLSNQFQTRGIPHQVLNAIQDESEAETIARAGESGMITIATNMAGRGTDIKLCPIVRKSGGLHIIATGLNPSRRIDRQLIGRAARQGDPGSYRFVCSVEQEMMEDGKSLGGKRFTWLAFVPARRSQLLEYLIQLWRKSRELRAERIRTSMFRAEKEREKSITRSGLSLTLESSFMD